MAAPIPRQRTVTITAQNTFSPAISLKKGGVLTLTGTWSATVSIQRYHKQTSAWVDITNNSGTATTFTTNGTFTIAPNEAQALYRWGVKTGNFTSGSIVGSIEGR
jgi:hypothetical protein